MTKWTRKIPRSLNPSQELKAIKKARNRSSGLPQGRAHQYIVQCQMVSSENICTGNIIQTEQVIFKHIYLYTYAHTHTHIYLHVTTSNEKKAKNLKKSKDGYMRRFGSRKGNGKLYNYILVSETKEFLLIH